MHPILATYRTLLETVDEWFAAACDRFPQQITCKAGCSACCRGFFDITLLDAALLDHGYRQLAPALRTTIERKARQRLADLQQRWPGFAAPYLLNGLPDEEWVEMPEEDMTPCPFLGDDGRCLAYAWRPMTCRLHGLPNIDLSGESFSDGCCSLNFTGSNPLAVPELRWEFRSTFLMEQDLFRRFTAELTGAPLNELDTLLPLVPLLDFATTDWRHLRLYRLPGASGGER